MNQKQWNDAWMEARKEDIDRFNEQSEKIQTEFENIRALHNEVYLESILFFHKIFSNSKFQAVRLHGVKSHVLENEPEAAPLMQSQDLLDLQIEADLANSNTLIDESLKNLESEVSQEDENDIQNDKNEPEIPIIPEIPAKGESPALHEQAELDAHHVDIETENSEISDDPIDHEPSEFIDQDAAVKKRKAARHDAPRSRHLPKVIIIGVKKCGTTALSRYMHIHPDLSDGFLCFSLQFRFNKISDIYLVK